MAISLRRVLAASVLGSLMVGCSSDFRPSMRACFPQGEDANLLAEELESRAVPYSRDGECFLIAAEHDGEFAGARTAAFGTPPPPGLGISRANTDGTPRTTELVELLDAVGVDTTVTTFRGQEYVVWDEADALRAEEALGLSREMREGMRKAREGRPPAPP